MDMGNFCMLVMEYMMLSETDFLHVSGFLTDKTTLASGKMRRRRFQ